MRIDSHAENWALKTYRLTTKSSKELLDSLVKWSRQTFSQHGTQWLSLCCTASRKTSFLYKTMLQTMSKPESYQRLSRSDRTQRKTFGLLPTSSCFLSAILRIKFKQLSKTTSWVGLPRSSSWNKLNCRASKASTFIYCMKKPLKTEPLNILLKNSYKKTQKLFWSLLILSCCAKNPKTWYKLWRTCCCTEIPVTSPSKNFAIATHCRFKTPTSIKLSVNSS